MSCSGSSNCICGCCAGTSVQTPQLESNVPGQNAISYRAGTWATFKESMLARLSSSDYPALALLKTRDDDDFTIALLDATSVMLDILTFYQERLANEGYLRTATQTQSLCELSSLIGYQPSPGVSASTYVAFTLKAAPGQAPNPNNPAITIPQGTQVQSVPPQGQTAQTFETFSDIPAKSDWNALPVMSGIPWIPPGASGLYLSGTTTQLKLGDPLLLLGVDRETWSPQYSTPSEEWDVVVINQIAVDNLRGLTYVGWSSRLVHESGTGISVTSAWPSAQVFALRQTAGLFGHNAPDPNLFVRSQAPKETNLPNLINDPQAPGSWSWKNYQISSSSQIYLDSLYSKIVPGSWFALVNLSASPRLFVRDVFRNLWADRAPLGSQPSAMCILVDTDIYEFQPITPFEIFALDSHFNLRLDSAPFGPGAPTPLSVASNVLLFQAFSTSLLFTVDKVTSALSQLTLSGSGTTSVIIEKGVKAFQAVTSSQIFVLTTGENLKLELAPFGLAAPNNVIPVDSDVVLFQAISASEVFVLDKSGNLWFEQAPFGPPPPPNPPTKILVAQLVVGFQALSATKVFVLIGNELSLMYAPFDTVPPNILAVYSNCHSTSDAFHALSETEVVLTDKSFRKWIVSIDPNTLLSTATQTYGVSAKFAPAPTAQLFNAASVGTISLSQF